MERVYGKLIFLAERNFHQYEGIRLHLAIKNDGAIFVPKTLEYEQLPQGGPAPEFMNLTDTEAQALIDSLYDCGYRPTRATETAGQVQALQNHLHDMRTIVFKREQTRLTPENQQAPGPQAAGAPVPE